MFTLESHELNGATPTDRTNVCSDQSTWPGATAATATQTNHYEATGDMAIASGFDPQWVSAL